MDAQAPRPPVNLNRLVYFAAVVDSGSFTRAAASLGITKAVVSQQVAKLEQEVGTTLLVRTTRSVHATEAGLALHARCTVILRESAEALDELAQGVATPQGTLRVTAPFDYGSSVIVPVVTELARRHPRVEVVLNLSDREADVHASDLAIRVGWLEPSSRVTRRIATFQQWLVAAPTLPGLSRMREPDALPEFPFVANRSLPKPLVWRFTHAEHGQRTVHARSTLGIDATPAVLAAVLGGAGLSVLPDYLVAADVAAGRLRHVCPEWKLRSGGIHALFPPSRYRSAKVSSFVELLMEAEKNRRGT
ncbi:MAG: LysR family transcriptional regulator [Proteobacteria bacterium]|nr:MAG: LysR family transcriptional regulator [Pseudomonadota bacterium]